MGKAFGRPMHFMPHAAWTSQNIEKVWQLWVFMHLVNLPYSGAILQCSVISIGKGNAQEPRTLM